MTEIDNTSRELWDAVRNLVISHRLFPVEGYEFPQEEVAEFWKDIFSRKGLNVFGFDESPDGVHSLRTDFTLPDEPPSWLTDSK
ncbi:MAG: hypothetical protein ABIC40_00520 [bacterium]